MNTRRTFVAALGAAAMIAGTATATAGARPAVEHSLHDRQAAERKAERKRARRVAADPVLEAIAACESGGDPAAVSADGTYRGKYQFDLQTWRSVGGSGDPAAAPEAEQDRRALILMSQRGTSAWPTCGA